MVQSVLKNIKEVSQISPKKTIILIKGGQLNES